MMKNKINWGILGCGKIAHKFAKGLSTLKDARLLAVGSRSQEKAAEFAAEHKAERACGSYEALAADPEIDIIYVATPHPWHAANTRLCLENDKAVLCEKPFTVNAAESASLIAFAREKKLFLMEAMWMRFFPVMEGLRQWISEGRIGEVRMLKADFGFRAEWNEESRLFNPDLAGGALLDIGIYPLSLAYMVFGSAPEALTGLADIGTTGVDEQSAYILRFEGGKLAVLSSAVRTKLPHEALILGTEGSVRIPDFWHGTEAWLESGGRKPKRYRFPITSNGYQYEARAAMDSLRAGQTEHPLMPLDESLAIMQTMDDLRSLWGLRYPFE
jgi:predicted dehydrogenase